MVDEDGNLVGVISRNDVKRLSYISFGEEQRHIRTVADAIIIDAFNRRAEGVYLRRRGIDAKA